MKTWLTIQLGSREHYAIPRVLETRGQLSQLLTDSWIKPQWQPAVSKLSRSLALRHHADVPDHKVRAPTLRRIAFDVSLRARKVATWEGMYQRNLWFQKWSARQVVAQAQPADVCFSYSYGARLPFRSAKERGMSCVLGQIDPGPLEKEIVDQATAQYADLKLEEDHPPTRYWEEWREELELADRIVVNSPWSSDLLIRQGVPEDKIRLIPLAYEGSSDSVGAKPLEVRAEGAILTVLFLGQVILRKGVGQLFDAIRLLKGQSIRFVIAGPVGVKVPADIASNPAVRIHGAVNRQRAQELYGEADVFLLPTLSDGFAITQLEAMAHGLPVIASTACGAVVSHGIDGIILNSVTPEEIALALQRLAADPELLSRLTEGVGLAERYSMQALSHHLRDLDLPIV